MMRKMKMSKILIIDGDNALHRAYHKYGGFTNISGKPSSIIFGFPYIVRSAIVRIKPTKVYVVFDGGRSEHRLALLPTYKEREQKLGFDYENFQSQKAIAMKITMDLGIRVVHGKSYEADDLIYGLCRKHNKSHICILSGDKDFHQLISSTISVYSPHKEIELTHKNLHRYFPYHAEEVVDYLCLIGDKSDKIPGYGGIGEKRARQFLDKFGSIKNFLKSYNPSMGKAPDPIKMASLYKLNRQLIDLRLFYRKFLLGKMKLPIKNPYPLFQLPAVAQVAREYEVKTLLKSEFIQTFKDLAK
jgi:DNA polymerase-1